MNIQFARVVLFVIMVTVFHYTSLLTSFIMNIKKYPDVNSQMIFVGICYIVYLLPIKKHSNN